MAFWQPRSLPRGRLPSEQLPGLAPAPSRGLDALPRHPRRTRTPSQHACPTRFTGCLTRGDTLGVPLRNGTRDSVEGETKKGMPVGIFKRGVKTSQESGGLSAVPSFWRWWVSEGRPLADQAIQGDGLGNFADEISAQVTRIHPDMEWETAAGRTAQHALIITSGGISDRRSLAERCFRAAPPAHATWEYHPARQPDPEALRSRLDLGGSELDLSLTRVGLTLDAERQKADVSVFHPGFATIPEQARAGPLSCCWTGSWVRTASNAGSVLSKQ